MSKIRNKMMKVLTTALSLQLLFSTSFAAAQALPDEQIVGSATKQYEAVAAPEPEVEATTATAEAVPEVGAEQALAEGITEVDVDTDTDINNNEDLNLNTGNNDIGNNTIVTGLETGDIAGTVNLLNLGNSELGAGSSFSCQNIAGGAGDILLFADNPNRIDISSGRPGAPLTDILGNNNIVHVFEQTDTNLDNSIDINADTGDNSVSNNTKIDGILTGDINLGVNLINLADLIAPNLQMTIDVWNILGDFAGDINVAGLAGGAPALGTAINGGVDIDASQNTDLSNYFDLQMNTGENEYGSNTLVGDVATGSTNAQTNLVNLSQIASPMYFLLNVFGEWDGNYGGLDPNFTIVNVIDEALGIGQVVAVGGGADIDIDNDTTVTNDININANTGRNLINRNTIVGSIQTGNINIAENVVNILNSVDRRLSCFRLGIINIFGSWRHPIAGGGGGQESVPVAEETPPAVLGAAKENPLSYLPAAGADLENVVNLSGQDSEMASKSRPSNYPNRSPLWGLIAFLIIAYLANNSSPKQEDAKENV